MAPHASGTQTYIDEAVSTSELNVFFDASDPKIAHLRIPLMHVGPNDKGLYWEADVLKRIAPMFNGTTFKYDVDGHEGSSHVPNKLYSPHFDVGWVQKAWYDPKTKAMWVEGDVTHPDVIAKLQRQTSDGKRELNYASMGVLIDPEQVMCSICGRKMGSCEHERQKTYGNRTAYAVPKGIVKALHSALTNAPADAEAEICDVIFQELNVRGGTMDTRPNASQVGPTPTASNSGPWAPNRTGRRQPQEQEVKAPLARDNAGETMNNGVDPVTGKYAVTNSDHKGNADGDSPNGGKMSGREGLSSTADGEMPGTAPVPDQGGDAEVQLVDVIKAMATRLNEIESQLQQIQQGQGAETNPTAPMGSAAGSASTSPETASAPAPPNQEMADIAGKYYKKLLRECADKMVDVGKAQSPKQAVVMLADMSINQLETLSMAYDGITPSRGVASSPVRNAPQGNVPEYGAPMGTGNGIKTFADMSPDERSAKFNTWEKLDNCFRNPNATQGSGPDNLGRRN